MGFKIGNINIKNKVVLAPMAGISNPSYIKICEEMGLGYAVTELISSEAIIRDNKKTFDMLKGIEKIGIPVAIQIFGSDPGTMAEAAKILVSHYNVKIIDINFGCPVPKVAIRSQAGSSLLKNPEKIYDIVSRVKKSIDVPVTVKIRSGWDSSSINAVEVAKICEKAGASAIAIHARTRAQGYSGVADWNVIKEVKSAVNIPVIGNGDVTTPILAKKMLDETGCDAVMIGRGAMGNPWLIAQTIEYLSSGEITTKPSLMDKINMIKKHYILLEQDKSEKCALLEIRSHAMYYLKGLPNCAEIRSKICTVSSGKELFLLLDEYFNTCL